MVIFTGTTRCEQRRSAFDESIRMTRRISWLNPSTWRNIFATVSETGECEILRLGHAAVFPRADMFDLERDRIKFHGHSTVFATSAGSLTNMFGELSVHHSIDTPARFSDSRAFACKMFSVWPTRS